MVARAYPDLGGINGEQINQATDYSPRGLDKDSIQTFVFECDPLDPLTAILNLQGSNDFPSSTNAESIWVDLLTIDVDAEGGTFFVETDIEVARIRLVCKTGNYTGGRLKNCRSMR